jgi:hypothetical protein
VADRHFEGSEKVIQMAEERPFDHLYQYDLKEVAKRPDCPSLCLVCGLAFEGTDEELPWGLDGENPTYNYCPCCGVEFGYGDFTLGAVGKWRKQWMDRGSGWFEPARQPAEWNLVRQLSNVPDRVARLLE